MFAVAKAVFGRRIDPGEGDGRSGRFERVIRAERAEVVDMEAAVGCGRWAAVAGRAIQAAVARCTPHAAVT